MNITDRFRKYWHSAYYYFASDKGVQFAMTCKEAAHEIDMGATKQRASRFRFLLHLSLCQGCKNYLSLSKALGAAIRHVFLKNEKPDRLVQLNSELLAKHSKK